MKKLIILALAVLVSSCVTVRSNKRGLQKGRRHYSGAFH